MGRLKVGCHSCNWHNHLSTEFAFAILCSACNGLGRVEITRRGQKIKQKCNHCQGTGVCSGDVNKINASINQLTGELIRHGM